MRQLAVLVLVTLLFRPSIGITAAQANPPPKAYVHVYLIRGLLNVFSLGMDEIAAKLQKHGIYATVHNHLAWATLAEHAAAEYKSRRVRTIILVGHSAGGDAVASIAARLGELGVPVKLAITLDPGPSHTLASGHVDRYVNYYVSTGIGRAIGRSPQFRGKFQNIDVAKLPGVGHFNIDKNAVIEQKIIGEIRAAL
jgi:pimeloyl-ACP methyl ester carboxylesterase